MKGLLLYAKVILHHSLFFKQKTIVSEIVFIFEIETLKMDFENKI